MILPVTVKPAYSGSTAAVSVSVFSSPYMTLLFDRVSTVRVVALSTENVSVGDLDVEKYELPE